MIGWDKIALVDRNAGDDSQVLVTECSFWVLVQVIKYVTNIENFIRPLVRRARKKYHFRRLNLEIEISPLKNERSEFPENRLRDGKIRRFILEGKKFKIVELGMSHQISG